MKRSIIVALVACAFAICPDISHAQCFTCWQEEPGGPGSCDDATSGSLSCIEHSNGCWTNGQCAIGGGSGCFLAGTLIETEHGAIPIEDLMTGDRVVGLSDVASRRSADAVVRTYRVIQSEYFILNGSTRVTGTHPFRTPQGWVTVQDLEVGDVLIAANGREESVASIVKRTGLVRAYNIEVGGPHTFIANGYLVHNKGPTPGG